MGRGSLHLDTGERRRTVFVFVGSDKSLWDSVLSRVLRNKGSTLGRSFGWDGRCDRGRGWKTSQIGEESDLVGPSTRHFSFLLI